MLRSILWEPSYPNLSLILPFGYWRRAMPERSGQSIFLCALLSACLGTCPIPLPATGAPTDLRGFLPGQYNQLRRLSVPQNDCQTRLTQSSERRANDAPFLLRKAYVREASRFAPFSKRQSGTLRPPGSSRRRKQKSCE